MEEKGEGGDRGESITVSALTRVHSRRRRRRRPAEMLRSHPFHLIISLIFSLRRRRRRATLCVCVHCNKRTVTGLYFLVAAAAAAAVSELSREQTTTASLLLIDICHSWALGPFASISQLQFALGQSFNYIAALDTQQCERVCMYCTIAGTAHCVSL